MRPCFDVQVSRFVLRSLLTLFFAISACSAWDAQAIEINSKNMRDDELFLGLIGYNYTDREIDDYSVDGIGGGSISMSSPTSGGGGTTCCVRLSKRIAGPIRVKIRWQFDGCRYLIKDFSGGADEVRHLFYREAEVLVNVPVGKKPAYIESHFFSNGKIEVRLTEHASLPMVALDKKRPDKSSFPRCKDDKKPE